MANFLELSQELQRLTGTGGTGPTDVATATGIEGRIVNYVKNAWIDIQSHPKDWKWMWATYLAPAPGGAPLQTIASVTDYVLTDVQKVRTKTFISYLTATGLTDRQRMTYIPYDKFQQRYSTVVSANSRPINVTRLPTGNLSFYPPPNDIYSITFEYYSTPQIFAVNGDIPAMPLRFHQLIVYEALKRFGKAEDAPELIAIGEEEAGSEGSENKPMSGLWRALVWDQEMVSDIPDNEQAFRVVRVE